MQYKKAILPISMMAAATISTFAAKAEDARADALDLILTVVKERDDNEQARVACNSEAEGLRERILTEAFDAQAEAHDAVRRRCFSLITTYNAIPRGIPYAPGVECRPNAQLFSYRRLMLMSYAGSDVIRRQTPEEMERIRRAFETLRTFALSYNRTIAAHPDFPYSDLCRVADDDYRPPVGEQLEPVDWGFRPLMETDNPANIWEGARRGTLASLRQMSESNPLGIHVVDLLDLTPLAWAVIYDRPEHVRLLLRAGANPYGEPYRDRPVAMSPISIAEDAGRIDLVELMRSSLDEADEAGEGI